MRLPFRILLVEDNPVNQKIALLLLARIGYRADLANNGFEALRSVQRQRYDVVFMDMHMPEMDGLEATRRIRALDLQGARPWIVALTANAMQEDRKICLEAGMDDFVSKPIQGGDLRRALLNVPEGKEGKYVPEPATYPGDTLTVPDYLTEMLAEDSDSAAELVQLFLEDTASSLADMDAALAASDSVRVSRLLHGIKGSSAQMGALTMSSACAELEHAAAAGDISPTRKRMPDIRKIFSEVNHSLTSLLPVRNDA
jgi:CheY-like chemotaxis protein/HPt (histidine-containing phosphotransfer) domain-containing protein